MQIFLLAGRAWAEMGITAQNRSALSFSSTVSASCLYGLWAEDVGTTSKKNQDQADPQVFEL